MKHYLISIVLLALAQVGQAQHEGHAQDDAAGPSDWTEQNFILRAGNAQGVEQCFYLAGKQKVTWHFESTGELLVNFHVHPERDGQYHTVYLERGEDMRSGSGVFDAIESGAYCFEFGLRQPSSEDLGIQLRFKADAA